MLAAVLLTGVMSRAGDASIVLSNNLSSTTAGTSTAEGDTWLAASFSTDASDYALSSVTLMLQRVTSDGAATVSLYSDGGLEPGTLVGTLTSSGSISTDLTATAFQGDGLRLSANSTYWLVLQATAGAIDWGWTTSNTGSGPGFRVAWSQSDDAGQSWFTADNYPFQMSVTADAVPEPATASLAGFGAIGLLTRWRSRRRPAAQ